MAATLDLGALSYTMKIKKDGNWSSGFSDAEGDLKNYQEKVKQADEINKTFESSMKGFASSLSATGTSFENIDAKLKLWFMDNKESANAIDINNKAIDSNKAKMAELDEQLTKGNTILKETSTVFGESSEQYKKVENSIVGLEISYKELEEENRRLATSNKEMEESANPSFFDRLKSSVTGVGTGTEEVAEKGKKSSGILSSAFGSVKNVVMNTAIPIMAGMGLQSLIDKATASQQALGQMNTVLNSTHGAAGMTRDALLNLASSQAQVTTYSNGANVATENLLLTFTNIGSKTFPQALTAVNDMSTALGQDTKESAIQLGKALNDPVKGITALSRVGVSFTEQQKDQIAAMEKAGNVAGAQGVILQELQKEFGGSAEAAGKTFGGQLSILKNQLFSVGTSIMSQLMPPLTSFMGFINAHMPQIQSIVSSVINGISTTFKTLGPIVLGIGQDILKIATIIFPQLSGSSGNLDKTLLDLAKGGLTTVKEIFDWLAQHGEVTRAAIIGIGSAIATLKIAQAITGAIDGIKNMKKAMADLKTAGSIFKFIFGADPLILAIVAGVALLAGGAYLIIKNWGPISNFFKNLWKDVTNVTSSAWNGIKSFFSGLWTWISNFFKQWGTVISSIWLGIKTVILGPVLLILDLVTGNFRKLASDAQGIFNNLKGALNGIWGGIKQVFIGTVQVIGTLLQTLWSGIVNTAQSLWNNFTSFMSNLWSNIKNTAINAWTSLKSSVINLVTSIVQGAINLWNSLISWFENLPGRLYNLGVSMFTSMRNGVSSAISTIGSVITNGFNSAISFLESLPGKALTWGKDFIDGLIKGITGSVGAIGNAVSGIGDTIRSFLHFSVPDEGPLTDYESWMPDFMKGLSQGIEKNKHLVTNAVKNLAGDVKVGMNLAPAIAGVSNNIGENNETTKIDGSNGLAIHFNGSVTLNGYKDVKKFARDIYNVQQDYINGKGGN